MEFTRVYTSSFSFLSTVTRCRHDVFLSFRGEDTRHNITQQLHRALVEANIPTFKDDINLQKGGEIASELLKAIQMSRIAIIVFSKNYATSGWCLDELVQILECKNQAGMLVLPIFYDVDPLHVEHQTGTFGEAFTAQEERFRNGNLTENKLEKWRAALTEAASLSRGWDLSNVASWHQSKFIKEIVKHIMDRHQDAHMNVSIFPPGMDSGKEYLNLLLSVISDDVLIIGICGMGKTTIAKAVYDQNFQRFEGSSFLSNVSRIAETPDGLLALQKQLLSDILIKDGLNIDNVEKGTEIIKNELCCKRIFVVLDNVNSLDQLNALARKRDWYGSGSRIIITTEDAQLLNVLEVDDVYGAQGIQVIKDKYRKNLQIIEDCKDFILKSHTQAYERERLLIAEIKAERMKRTSEAQNIDDIEESLDQMFPLRTLTSTMNAIMIGMGDQGCGLGAFQGNTLDFEPEEEIISKNALVGNGGETRMPLCYAYGGFGERINRDDTAEKDSVQGTMHLSIPGISDRGVNVQPNPRTRHELDTSFFGLGLGLNGFGS